MAISLSEYLLTKGREYAPFDPNRAHLIYQKLSLYIDLSRVKKIHIIGTNGKGSTGRYLALMLRNEGCKILHFTSPHIFDFKERFYKNDSIILTKDLEEAHIFLQTFDFINACSYFEYMTFLALILAKDVDYLIMEAGLGGEFDSTSVLEYDLDIFTHISLDHQDMLGEDLEQIAKTKLAAMGKNAILSTNQDDRIYALATKIANQKNSHLIILKTNDMTDEIKRLVIDLPDFLSQNAFSAIMAFKWLLNKIPSQLPRLNLLGRMQKITPNVYLDVGHNVGAAKAIKQALQKEGIVEIVLIYNSYEDKNIKEILQILSSIIRHVEILKLEHPRVIALPKLCAILDSLNLKYKEFSCLEDGVKYLVFGSFSVAETFMKKHKDLESGINNG